MIEHIEIRNFQSLHHVALELSPFTVIVGPSSSGKSAFTRALRTLIANRRGADFITHGERVASVSARTSRGIVTLTRGKGTTDNAYTVIPSDPEHKLAPKATYTKLGGEVPTEVSDFLGIDPKDPIAFAAQFDKPYLLDDSAAEVARVLGSLTNVSVIFDASRESNRRKLASSQTLKTRHSDLEAIKAKVPEYKALKSQDEALTEAEALIAEAYEIEKQIRSLSEALDSRAVAVSRIEALAPILAIEVPDETELVEASVRLQKLRDALLQQRAAQKAVDASQEALTAASDFLDDADQAYLEFTGLISNDLLGFLRDMATDEDRRGEVEGKPWIEVGYAAELFTQYLETKAG